MMMMMIMHKRSGMSLYLRSTKKLMLALSTTSQSGRKIEEEKTTKYGPLRWNLKQKYQGYEVKHYNIIMDLLGGWCRDCKLQRK